MGEIGEDWRFWNERSKNHRNEKQEWSKELLSEWCESNGVTMKELQPWHIRITKDSKTLDIFPQRQKYHDVSKNKRGEYKDLIVFVEKHFNEK